jgi:hypothetical protein
MGKVSEITITKGKTIKATDRDEWVKIEFSVKAAVDEEEEVEAARTYILGLLDGWLSSSLPSPTSAAQERLKPVQETLESVKGAFPPELRELLNFEQGNGCFIIKPRQFLGSENFARIAELVRNMQGEYVSSGKDSHFRIPIK